MTKLWDIIDFARQTGIADADFVATYDPEHIALMEEVVRIALNSNPYGTCDCAGCAATQALHTYRKEHGLDV